MGWWKSENGVIGDSVADIMVKALRRVVDEYKRTGNRMPTQGEMADLIEFCSRGILVPQVDNPAYVYDPDDDNSPRAQPCGRQGVFGDASAVGGPGLRNVNPATGERIVEAGGTAESWGNG